MTPKPTNPQDKDKAIDDKLLKIVYTLMPNDADTYRHGEEWLRLKKEIAIEATKQIKQLLAQPSIVLPEVNGGWVDLKHTIVTIDPKATPKFRTRDYISGYIACLDDIKRLNPGLNNKEK